VLLLGDHEIRELLPISDCLELAARAYRNAAERSLVTRPRTTLALSLESNLEYALKTWDSGDEASGIATVRMASNVLRVSECGERCLAEAVSSGASGGFTGLVAAFSISSGDLLAILHDAYLSALSVALPIGVAAQFLARPDASSVGMLGTGRQARLQLAALARVRRLIEVRVFDPRPSERERFAAAARADGLPARPVPTATEAVTTCAIVATATSSPVHVLEDDWVVEGTHVTTTRPSEVPASLVARADVVVVPTAERPTSHSVTGAGRMWGYRPEYGVAAVPLGDIVAGYAPGRGPGATGAKQITLFGAFGGRSPGQLYPALAAEVMRRASVAGVGRQLPDAWFVQDLPS
jgi:ornithine cyclodeaminase/alanine dehydrogenase-like protein (mu-crystallin family)